MVDEVTAPLEVADEAALLDDLRAGRADAFERLVRAYGGRMRSAALRLLRCAEDADDAVQDAFLSAFRSLDSFEGKARVGTWLHRIAINASLMKLRSRRRASDTEAELEELMPRFAPSGAFARAQVAWSEDPDDPLEREELCAHVRECIDRLPDKFRVPLVLRDVEGLSNEEIAAQLGVSVNAAKIRAHRARQALRTLLEPRFGALHEEAAP